MIKLTMVQQNVHNQAVEIVKRRGRDEIMLIENLQKNQRMKVYKFFGRTSLFQYAVHDLRLPESVAYYFISVARKAIEIPSLQKAIQGGRLPVAKASRIVSALKKEGAEQLIEFAVKNSQGKTDREVARINPKSRSQEKTKWLSEDVMELTTTMSKKGFEDLCRAESLAAQKGKKFSGRGDVIELALAEYVERHDPVQKAERAMKRKMKGVQPVVDANVDVIKDKAFQVTSHKSNSELCFRVPASNRVALTAETEHALALRDQGQCVHINIHGERCNSDRHTQIHHIVRVADGGTNELNNLATLCSVHHDLVHQLSFPIDYQVNWLRSPTVDYKILGLR